MPHARSTDATLDTSSPIVSNGALPSQPWLNCSFARVTVHILLPLTAKQHFSLTQDQKHLSTSRGTPASGYGY